MADINKIKEILRRDLRTAAKAKVTEQHLTEIAQKIALGQTVDEATMRKVASEVVGDPDIFIVAAVDVGDIESELKKPRK